MVKLYTIFDKELNQRMFYLIDNYRRVVVTSIDLDADKESASYGESVTFTAVVTDKDNNPVSGSTVSFYNINSRLGAAISDGNGVATFSYVVRHDLSVNARADEVQSNTVAVTMDEDVYELVLSCDAPIIESGGSTSVNCLLTHNGDAVSGESLNYIINHGSTSIDSGSVTTGNDGTASISYTGTGVGDVTFTVEYGTLLQKTYEVEDCMKYYPLVDNSDESAFTIPTGTTVSYSDEGMRLSANAYKQIKLTDKLTSDCSVEFTISDYNTPSNNYEPVIIYAYTNGETTPNQEILRNVSASTMVVFGQTLNRPIVKGAKYRIEYTSSTLKLYENDELLGTKSNNIGFPTRFEWHMGANNRYAVYKDLKVKAL